MRAHVRFAAYAAALLALTGCSGDGGERRVATEPERPPTSGEPETAATADDVQPAGLPRLPARLQRAPAGCRGGAPRERVSAYGTLFGRSPVWAGIYGRWARKASALHLGRDAPRTRYGWRVKVLWILAPRHADPVRVSGWRGPDERPVWFEPSDAESPASAAMLDPANPGVPAASPRSYKEFPSYAYFPGAGCYVIETHWGRGAWRIVLGVGS